MTDRPFARHGGGLSTLLWMSGAFLWIAVAVLLVAVYLQGPADSRAEEGEAAGRPAGSGAAAGGLVESGASWDPKGIGDFTLTERSGDQVTKNDLIGKPWIVGFVFTRCAGPCPKVTSQMRRLQNDLADQDARLVTMTVDPDFDTPAVLARYADAFGADDEKWLFLTGDKETMYRYIEKHFKMPVQEMQGEDRKPGFEVLHTTNLLLIDSKGVVRDKYNALIPEELVKLRVDLKKLSSEE